MLEIVLVSFVSISLATNKSNNHKIENSTQPGIWHHRRHKCRSSSSPRQRLLASRRETQSQVARSLGRPNVAVFSYCCKCVITCTLFVNIFLSLSASKLSEKGFNDCFSLWVSTCKLCHWNMLALVKDKWSGFRYATASVDAQMCKIKKSRTLLNVWFWESMLFMWIDQCQCSKWRDEPFSPTTTFCRRCCSQGDWRKKV